MEIISINKKQDLIKRSPEIATLFLQCFQKRQFKDLWTWAYIKNPNGEPLVTLCYDNNQLIGHYAIIPMPISFKKKQSTHTYQ